MTFLGIACKGDVAEIVVDTFSYWQNGRHTAPATKVLLMPHLDAAVTAAGEGKFCLVAKMTVLSLSNDPGITFDRLLKDVTSNLVGIWEECFDSPERLPDDQRMSSNLVLVGYSDAAGEFVAYNFPMESGFAAERISGVLVQPAPVVYRPNDHELDFIYRQVKKFEEEAPKVPQGLAQDLRDKWAAKEVTPVPDSLEDWWLLAEMSRETRSMRGTLARVYIGGSLLHTRLRRDLHVTRKIHDFDDSDDNLRKMMSESDHPLVQLGPCPCGSGETFLSCHLAKVPDDKPCGCGQDKPYVKCCRLDAVDEPEPTDAHPATAPTTVGGRAD